MELLIPGTVRAIMAKGYAEGRAEGHAKGHALGYAEGLAEGRTEGRKRELKRMISALRAARGIDPDRPEFEQFLLGFAVDKPDDSR